MHRGHGNLLGTPPSTVTEVARQGRSNVVKHVNDRGCMGRVHAGAEQGPFRLSRKIFRPQCYLLPAYSMPLGE